MRSDSFGPGGAAREGRDRSGGPGGSRSGGGRPRRGTGGAPERGRSRGQRHPGPPRAPRRQRPERATEQRGTEEPQEKVPAGVTRMFASVVPGLAPLVVRELEQLDGVRVTDSGFDGRSDLILFDVDRGRRDAVWTLRTVEDLFVEVGRTMRSSGDRPHWIAGRVWRPERVEKALSVWSAQVRPLAGAMSYRVIARVLQEQSFLRTDLRKSLGRSVSRDRPKWKVADPAQIEVWISEYRQGRLIAGLRLSDASMRQHQGRRVERSGALRPTVAAMMVGLAGDPDGVLLDPCCGSGTVPAEALAAGWEGAEGRDIDPEAVAAAEQNVPRGAVRTGDARDLGLPDASVGAVVSNLPFGQQYGVQGGMAAWLTDVLAEAARVTRPGGRVVLLAPEIPREAVPEGLRLRSRDPIRLLGTRTTLWVYDRG
ncbi:methyltransferase domain-containing protein [Streptomyces sp. JJ36]|uniref:methyltransferase domain-containing protein n=1 Tax=Streptomyces sp. JJ36 TaxID=2736645 RepID=UPI001F009663|nr:methyltransferase domain-containing protein [Streptomyces sp. JJ36]MCF6523658.1 methyltransferase domain-containing protein [Streptomyces sp. JJ36]